MTTGSFLIERPPVPSDVYTRARFSPNAAFGNWEYQGVFNTSDRYSKTWSGADRTPGPRPIPVMRKRYYTYWVNRGEFLPPLKQKGFFLVPSYPRKREKKKDMTPHPYSVSIRRFFDAPCTVIDTLDWPGVGWNQGETKGAGLSRYHQPSTAGQPEFTANHQIQLVSKLKSNLRGSEFNMAVFLGEGHQMLNMITSSATRLYRAYSAFRHGDMIDAVSWLVGARESKRGLATKKQLAKRYTGDISRQWLELQYGWLPLLSDMKSGAEALSHYLNVSFSKRYVVRRNLKVAIDSTSPFGAGHDQTGRRLVAYISEPESLPVISGLLDPELVAWELTPFSFVADWVIPIGDYLDARAFASRLEGTFVTTDYRKTIRTGGRILDVFSGSQKIGYTDFSQSSLRYEAIDVSRSVSKTLEVPMPVVKPFNKIASWQHCANALALLGQMFASGKIYK